MGKEIKIAKVIITREIEYETINYLEKIMRNYERYKNISQVKSKFTKK